MEYKLISGDKYRGKLQGLLDALGFIQTKDGGDVAVVEKQMVKEDWDHPLAIVINSDRFEDVEAGLQKLIRKEPSQSPISSKHIVGKSDDKFAMVAYENIKYFSASSNDVYFHADQTYTCKPKLYELEQVLKDRGFVRINKSEIVNIKQVREIIPWFNSRLNLVLSDNTEVMVTKTYTKSFKEYIGF